MIKKIAEYHGTDTIALHDNNDVVVCWCATRYPNADKAGEAYDELVKQAKTKDREWLEWSRDLNQFVTFHSNGYSNRLNANELRSTINMWRALNR